MNMRSLNDTISQDEKKSNYFKNYGILLKKLSPNVIKNFNRSYITFLLDDDDFYIHKFLFKNQ